MSHAFRASSFCGFLRGKPYVVRLVAGTRGPGEWLVEMSGLPPIVFPARPGDSDAAVRHTAEQLLMLTLPEDG